MYIPVSYMHKYQGPDFASKNNKYPTYSNQSFITSLLETYQYVRNCVSYMYQYQCLLFIVFETKFITRSMYV